ncbi:hypothetical protein FWK35_00016653 [Aphis craccivora]|uniref:Uncharacterized protein n=1 Tax=Aphis craccivora TaxID=307492 RepID=A0A6G0YBW4_APHCR|nr:hypothetical protein FWK35_00016653 [Aphis craccivora]
MLIKKKLCLCRYSYNFLITIRITYEKLCIKFSSILIGPKKIFRKIENFSCLLIAQKKSKYFENLTVYR